MQEARDTLLYSTMPVKGGVCEFCGESEDDSDNDCKGSRMTKEWLWIPSIAEGGSTGHLWLHSIRLYACASTAHHQFFTR